MTNISTNRVKVQNGDLAMDAYMAMPQEKGKYPAVVVIQEIFGVNEHIRDITERLAREGYVAIAPAIYQRQAPGFEVGYTEADTEIGRKYKNQTKATELLSDIQATINYLYSLPQVKSGGVGAIGFCFWRSCYLFNSYSQGHYCHGFLLWCRNRQLLSWGISTNHYPY